MNENPNVCPVYLITDGPETVMEAAPPVGDTEPECTEPAAKSLIAELAPGDKVVFRMTLGLLCTNVRDDSGRLEIEPLMLTPIPLAVTVMDVRPETENPNGLMLLARVDDLKEYHKYLPAHLVDTPEIKIGDLVLISYHTDECAGGLRKLDLTPPIVNSSSRLHREYVIAKESGQQRGRGIYKITHANLDALCTAKKKDCMTNA